MPQKLDANLIKYRLLSEANLTLKDLAAKLKRDPSTISMVIHGRRKSAPIMQAIVAILDPTLSETQAERTDVADVNKEDAA